MYYLSSQCVQHRIFKTSGVATISRFSGLSGFYIIMSGFLMIDERVVSNIERVFDEWRAGLTGLSTVVHVLHFTFSVQRR